MVKWGNGTDGDDAESDSKAQPRLHNGHGNNDRPGQGRITPTVSTTVAIRGFPSLWVVGVMEMEDSGARIGDRERLYPTRQLLQLLHIELRLQAFTL